MGSQVVGADITAVPTILTILSTKQYQNRWTNNTVRDHQKVGHFLRPHTCISSINTGYRLMLSWSVKLFAKVKLQKFELSIILATPDLAKAEAEIRLS